MKKIALIIFIAVFVLFAAIVITECSSESAPEQIEPPLNFETATYEEKQAAIEAYLKSPDDTGYAMVSEIETQIKNRFNYPKSVAFNLGEAPLLSRGYVVDADSCWVFINGTGTAENAFKQESKFRYSVKLKITDKEINLLKIDISQ